LGRRSVYSIMVTSASSDILLPPSSSLHQTIVIWFLHKIRPSINCYTKL
jgi:hypothetical protein